MRESDDIALLREYVDRGCEPPLPKLWRAVSKVYSVALRHTHDPHQAEDGHINHIKIYNDGISISGTYDPPVGYDYQWSEN